MSKGVGTTRTTSTSGLPGFQEPYVSSMLSEAKRLYDSPGPSFFPGSTVAGFQPAEILGANYLQETAGRNAQQNDELLKPALGEALTAYQVDRNPVVQNMAQQATQPIIQQLREEVLPGIKSGAIAAGSQGGSRQGIAEAQGMERAATAAMNTKASVLGNAYSQGLNALLSGLNMAPTLQQNSYAPGMVLAGVGEKERGLEQAKIDEAVARHQYEQNLPFQKLMEYANLVKSPFGGTQTSEVNASGGGAGQAIGAGLTAGAGLIELLRRLFP